MKTLTFPLSVAARISSLSQVQTQEVLEELRQYVPEASFETHLLATHGDKDLTTSLRTLDKTDFFTREVDELVLSGQCAIAIHSAKDLPESLPKGLKLIALTKGVDSSDSIVLRDKESFFSLPAGAKIATSSKRREELVKILRPDLSFCDLRGTIQARLNLLDSYAADGIVVAEAALIRLKLTHLNRLKMPFKATHLQGQLAILAKETDQAMEDLFKPLDSRQYPKALYLGTELPLFAFPNRQLIHCPLIETEFLEKAQVASAFQKWNELTHLVITSKVAVKALIHFLKTFQIPYHSLQHKVFFAVGKATKAFLETFGAQQVFIPSNETAEGLIELMDSYYLKEALVFWPHSSLSRPIIAQYLQAHAIPFIDCVTYQTKTSNCLPLPPLTEMAEVLFSSPSTVEAFFSRFSPIPNGLKLTPIGPITEKALQAYLS